MKATIHLLRVLLVLPLLSVAALAQKEGNFWYFGTKAGIDFNGPTPVVTDNSPISTSEGSAAIADPKTGQLLFYTDGVTVWNRNHTPMPNGTGLAGGSSSTQAALIVPAPNDPTLYYIFTTAELEGFRHVSIGMQYSVVDLDNNGGLGDVTVKNVPLLKPGTERLAATRRCDGSVWVVTQKDNTDEIHAFAVTDTGVSLPVISHVGPVFPDASGCLAFSPDGERLAMAVYSAATARGFFLFDFDMATGVVSNRIDLLRIIQSYGVCFSPDNSRLYATSLLKGELFQFDLTSGDAATIVAAKKLIFEEGNYRMNSLQLAPDGKIYVSGQRFALSVIEEPNELDVACGYVSNGLDLGAARSHFGLPNNWYYSTRSGIPPQGALRVDTAARICAGSAVTLSASGAESYLWSPAEGLSCTTCPNPVASPSRTITYRVTGIWDACAETRRDSATVTVTVVPAGRSVVNIDSVASICSGESVRLNAGGATRYAWSPADGLSCVDCPDPIASPSVTTTYRVVASDGECDVPAVDSVTVTVVPVKQSVVSLDSVAPICSGGSVRLSATGAARYTWSPANGLSCVDCPDPIASPSVTTTYGVIASDGECDVAAVDSVTVTVVPVGRSVVSLDSVAPICRGESVRLSATGAARFVWSPADGLSCVDCSDPVATPFMTTTYRVVASDGECDVPAVDSVTVQVRSLAMRARIESRTSEVTGAPTMVPIVLDGVDGPGPITRFRIRLRYDTTLVRLSASDLVEMTRGTLVDGWSFTIEDSASGQLSVIFEAPTPTSRLTTSGVLLNAAVRLYVGHADSTILAAELEPLGFDCPLNTASAGTLRMKFCGATFRLIELTDGKFLLRPAVPNPFNPSTRIDFSIALDGPASLEILDASGAVVAVLADENLPAGAFSATWDASAFPSGLYFCRLRSGDRTAVTRLLLVK